MDQSGTTPQGGTITTQQPSTLITRAVTQGLLCSLLFHLFSSFCFSLFLLFSRHPFVGPLKEPSPSPFLPSTIQTGQNRKKKHIIQHTHCDDDTQQRGRWERWIVVGACSSYALMFLFSSLVVQCLFARFVRWCSGGSFERPAAFRDVARPPPPGDPLTPVHL